MAPKTLRIEPVVSLPFEEISYIVHQPGRSECFVVDPGFEPDRLLRKLRELELEVSAILNTHGHVDHIAGNQAIKDAFPAAPLVIGAGDARMLTDPFLNLSRLGGSEVTSPPADLLVHDNQPLEVIGLEFLVREIPGHTPGHVAYIWLAGVPPIVFGGDILFAGSVGRFDLPGGDGRLLVCGIREKLYVLPPETLVYPGHGTPTSIADEIASNPYTRSDPLF
jgi:glyoxylase-like metal-dependent hydrolase (beta-lactamase superfamily II)